MFTVGEIAERLNARAETLARDLLPNGHRAGNFWKASGIADTGRGESLVVNLTGDSIGHWKDFGNCAAGEERGDMIDLLRLVRGLDAAGAVAEAKAILGIEDKWGAGARKVDRAELDRRAQEARERAAERAKREAARREAKGKRARALYLSAGPIKGSPAEAYLVGRGLSFAPFEDWPGAVRFHAECWHDFERCKLPAMVSAIYDLDGAHIGTHRTFLTRDPAKGWVKIGGGEAKLVVGAQKGGFIPISKGASGKPMRKAAGEPVYVTEGIEDAIVVRMVKPDARIIAAINLGNIGDILLPPPPDGERRQLVICCDRDSNPKAQATLERAIAKQQGRGVDVRLVFPPVGIKDLNDWLRLLQSERKTA